MIKKLLMSILCGSFSCAALAADSIEGEYKATAGSSCDAIEVLDRELNQHGYFIKLIKVTNGVYKAVLPKAGGAESEDTKLENGELNLFFKGDGNQILMTVKRHENNENTIMMTEWLNYMQHGLKEQMFDVLNDEFPNKPNPIRTWSSNKGLCLVKNN